MRKFFNALCAMTLLFASSAVANAQCQDQVCQFGGQGCFICQAGNGFGCSTSVCSSCTTTQCGKGRAGLACNGVSDQLSVQRNIIPASMSEKAQSQLPPFAFAPIGKEKDPAVLLSVRLNHEKALMEAAEFVNQSGKKIVADQLGWVFGTSSDDAKITLAPAFEIPDGLAPEAVHTVPAQPFSRSYYQPGMRAAFFVASVKFADGTSWAADIERIKQQALPGDSSGKQKKDGVTSSSKL